MKEIYKEVESANLIQEAINELSEVVQYTYGPNGNTVIISDDEDNPYATKDGVSVAKSVNFKNPVKQIAATLIKQVADKTLKEAGDGTSTSIILANSFINKGFKELNKGVSYNHLKQQLEELLAHTIDYLYNRTKGIKNIEELYEIALIASNSDKEIANIVKNAFEHSDLVKVEEGDNDTDELVKIEGMKILSTYFSQVFVNNESKFNIEYKDCALLLIEGKLESLDPISNILQNIDEPLIIIADHFSDSVVSILKDNYNRGALKVALVKSPGIGSFRKKVMQDIAMYANAKVVDETYKFATIDMLGKLDGIEINKENTILYNSNADVTDRIDILKEYLDTDIPQHEKDLTNQRIEQLNGKVSIIRVGGKSEIEIKERLDRIDDAIRAVGCALEEGVIVGAGQVLVGASSLDNIFNECLQEPSKILLGDKYLIPNKDIKDPLKVVRCALENAVSVAKTILGTKAVVLNKELWEKE